MVPDVLREWTLAMSFMFLLYGVIVLVHILCPAPVVEGYVCDPLDLHLFVPTANNNNNNSSNRQQQQQRQLRPLLYCLNGFRCFWMIVVGFLVVHYVVKWTSITLFLAQHYDACAFASNFLGLLASFYFVNIRFPHTLSPTQQRANGLRRAPTIILTTMSSKNTNAKKNDNDTPRENASAPSSDHPLDWDDRRAPFFYGKEFNPRWTLNGVHWWWPLVVKNSTHPVGGSGSDNDTTTKKAKANESETANNKTILDVKMALYIMGALVLQLNVVSAVLYEQELRGDGSNSNALLLYAGLFTWFVLDYLWYEEVHLYTYDLFAEKMGFKLLWGCLCFYPFFYPIGTRPFVMTTTTMLALEPSDVIGKESDLDMRTMLMVALVYTLGSVLTRGANMQKFLFRRNPHQARISLFGGMLVVQQRTVPSSNGRLLCSGFWGLSRHVNYAGEILQAVGLALPAWLYASANLAAIKNNVAMTDTDHNNMLLWVSWLYPIYYVALFLPRQRDDEKLMRQKYGDKVMDEYIQLVPYRMIPGLY